MKCYNCHYNQPIYKYNCDELPCEIYSLVTDKQTIKHYKKLLNGYYRRITNE